ncbi:metallophosphoesterase [soil metagenome]
MNVSPSRARGLAIALLAAALLATMSPISAVGQSAAPTLLTDPYLQRPTNSSVAVAWVTEFPGRRHRVLVGRGVADLSDAEAERLASAGRGRGRTNGVRVFDADTTQLTSTAEDAASRQRGVDYTAVTPRPLRRHEAEVRGIRADRRSDYRVMSANDDGESVLSDTFTLTTKPRPGEPQKILLTSDHQLKDNTPANLQKVVETVGRVDAVFFAGDLVNVPDRASEWFDDERELSFFPGLQGTANQEVTRDGTTSVYTGGEIIQHAPLYTAVGNHEVMGRRNAGDLGTQFNSPLPVEVAERLYEQQADDINPTGDPKVRERWIHDHSFNIDTYEQLFTLPISREGGESYWAETIGDVRLISLYATKIWRSKNATRDATGAFREASANHGDDMAQGWGEHIFESLENGSEQYEWLEEELDSAEFRRARLTVVMMHEAVHSVGDNVLTPFTDPVRIEERDDDGALTRIRYEYPRENDQLRGDVKALMEQAGVDLVFNGHSHLWNRFHSADGVDYIETSNVGNNYGAFTEQSGRSRSVPPPPWDADNYVAQGDPGGLEPIVPTVDPVLDGSGQPQPYIASNDLTAFSILDTGDGTVTSYVYDVREPDQPAHVFDRFSLSDPDGEGGRGGRNR